jgi:hypothetical protein
MFEFNVKLVKPARKSGGDKYESVGAMPFNVYVPQVISRSKDGYPAEQLKVTIEVE